LHQIPSFNEYENLSLLIIVNCAWRAGAGKPAQFLKIMRIFPDKHEKKGENLKIKPKWVKKPRNLKTLVPAGLKSEVVQGQKK